ncbi:MAG: dihydroxyacetone kinase subunit DhaL [Rhodobacteraceae bacterium]|jgi:dihydroxyacetone kinase-like protein|nr:dihydroxyacetone kinase subunit DhaL [Paracoccaceae bacterium]
MDVTTDDLKTLFRHLAARMAAERDRLCALDGLVGDGDHGIAMEQGMAAASGAVDAAEGTLQDLFNAGAKGFLNAVGASSGPLYATALLRAGKAAGARPSMPRDDLRHVIAAMRDGVAQRGKAAPGMKTMLDTWHPAAEAALSGADAAAIAAAARDGAEATRTMVAMMGRSERLGERSLGHADPGAVSAVIVVEAFCHAMQAKG